MLRRNQRVGDPDYYDFSFSGLKTAVVGLAASEGAPETAERVPDIASAFQEAAVEVLVAKTIRAVEETGCGRVVLGGGVSANERLREEMRRRLEGCSGVAGDRRVFHASPRLSLDNGAMVARAARFRFDRGEVAPLEASASPTLAFPGLADGSRDRRSPPT